MVRDSLNDLLAESANDDGVSANLFRCLEGTLIRTRQAEGDEDRPIESLAAGDLLVTGSGAPTRLRAIGRRTVLARFQRDARLVWPVRIHRDALGPGRPSHDLLVSPQQAVTMRVVTNVTIPALWLVNGSTIDHAQQDEVTYWHLELERHEQIIANGLPVESARAALQDAGRRKEDPDGDLFLHEEDDEPLLEAIRDVVATRARTLGWAPSSEVAFFLLADGARVPHELVENEAFAAIPPGTRELRICVPLFKPAWFGIPDDRKLGLAVRNLTLIGTTGQRVSLDLDAAETAASFHDGERAEGCEHRWTMGDLVVPLRQTVGQDGTTLLRLAYDSGIERCWRQIDVDPDRTTT